MSPLKSIETCFRKYAVFSGRASRSEFSWWMLFWVVVLVSSWNMENLEVGFLLDSVIEQVPFSKGNESFIHVLKNKDFQVIFFIFTVVPTLSVSVRRLHDSGRGGWWIVIPVLLLALFLFLFFLLEMPEISWAWYGSLVLSILAVMLILIMMLFPGTKGDNQFGPDPKSSEESWENGWERGLEKGREEGLEKGREEGLKEGEMKGRAGMVRQLLLWQNIEVSQGFADDMPGFADSTEADIFKVAINCKSEEDFRERVAQFRHC